MTFYRRRVNDWSRNLQSQWGGMKTKAEIRDEKQIYTMLDTLHKTKNSIGYTMWFHTCLWLLWGGQHDAISYLVDFKKRPLGLEGLSRLRFRDNQVKYGLSEIFIG
jgi:hypothetical protein